MANRYWVGGPGYWNDTAHWSDTSGGAGGASVPADGDNVYVDTNSNSTGDFTIHINTDTANLYQMKITYPSSKGQVYIIQDYSSSLGRCYDFKCYYGALNNDYLNGGLISGNSTSDYSKTRWQKGQNGTTARMYLTRFVWWGNMTSSDDGFQLVSGGNSDAFAIHVYGTDCRNNTRAFIYRVTLHIHTLKTVSFTHPDGSGTWYGCDVSYSQRPLMSVGTLYIYDNAKLCCDMTNHGSESSPQYSGCYISPLSTSFTPISMGNGAELDIGILLEGILNGGTVYNLPTLPRFLYVVAYAGTVYFDCDVIIQGTNASYVCLRSGYTSGNFTTIDFKGHNIKTPKLTVAISNISFNDISPLMNYTIGAMVTNVNTIQADNILVLGTSGTTAYNKIQNVGTITDYNNSGAGANITCYTGNYKGGEVDLSTATSATINSLTMSDTTYAQKSIFRAPTTGTWVQKGNINFGSKAIFYNNGGTMTLGNNIAFTNTSTNSHFNNINFGNYVLTVNNKLEFYNSNVSDGNIALGTNAWAVCKNANGVANEYWVWGSLNWSTPQAYPLTANSTPSDGITVDIRNPSSGSTLFTFDTDNIGVKRIIVRRGCTYRVVTNVDVYAQDLTDYGTLYRGAGYYGYIHYGSGMTPFNYKQLELPKKLDRTVMEFMKVMD